MGGLSVLAIVVTIPAIWSDAQLIYSQYPNHPLNIGPLQTTYSSNFPFVPVQTSYVPLGQTYTTTYNPEIMGNRYNSVKLYNKLIMMNIIRKHEAYSAHTYQGNR